MKSAMGKLLTVIMAAFLLIFAGYHAYRHFFSDYSTVDVYRYTVYHTATSHGIFFRTEQSLAQPAGSHLRYAVEDGEKVRVGSVLAYRYNDALSADLARQQQEAQKELTMLQRVRTMLESSNTATVSNLTRNTDIALRRMAAAVALGQYDTLDELTLQLQEEINLGSGMTGGTAELNSRIAELENQTERSISSEAVYSTQEGYFSSYVDGREGQYTTESLETLTCEELQQMLTEEYPAQEELLGKIVSGPEWYFALTIDSKEEKNFPQGSKVSLSFSGGRGGSVEGTVIRSVESDDGNTVMLVIKGNAVTEDTVSRREAAVRLSSDSFTGVRFDKQYLRIVDGVKGVYVDNGYSVKFKTVDIIYEGDTYYLSRLNYTGEESLNIFDKLIDTKAELYDGMPLSDL